jgi:hypothetical protein
MVRLDGQSTHRIVTSAGADDIESCRRRQVAQAKDEEFRTFCRIEG